MAFVLVTLLANNSSAQQTFISGRIIDTENGLAINGASVTALKGDSLLYQTVSDSLGLFAIPLRFISTINRIRITHLSYFDLDVKNIGSVARSSSLGLFKLRPSGIVLKEIKIVSRRRYRDTSTIDLSKEKFERSVMINDLFSQYGFSRDNDGQIYFKGKPVSHLTVNGDDFFPKNKSDIYTLLPALALEKIQVVETNIDSLTNTTRLQPTIKVDLKFKEKYNKGAFGHANTGIGTSDRYLINTDLFTYRKKEQISLDLNSNNINAGQDLITPPTVSFSSAGNDILSNIARLTYRNVFAGKLELSIDVGGREQNKIYSLQTDRNDLDIRQVSHTLSESRLKDFQINNGTINLIYHPSPLTTLTVNQTSSYDHSVLHDSSLYRITTDTSNSVANNLQTRMVTNNSSHSKINYLRRFSSKKGRLINIIADYVDNQFNTEEDNHIYSIGTINDRDYFFNQHVTAGEKQFSLQTGFTEPVGLDGFINIFTAYTADRINNHSSVNGDTSINYLVPSAAINNQYLRSGIKFQHTFQQYELNADISGIYNAENIQGASDNIRSLFRVNADLRAEFKISDKKELALAYTAATTFPDLNQLSSLGSTFNLVSQATGNVNLKPEDKQSLKVSYSVKQSAAETIALDAGIDYYSNKFGYELSSQNGTPITYESNVGNSRAASLALSFAKSLSGGLFLNSSTALSYQEQPTIINGIYTLNNGVLLNQSLSTAIIVMHPNISVTPLINASFARYFYQTGNSNIANITYSGRTSLNTIGFEITLYPLFAYTYSVVHNSSFSLNGEVKRSFLKKKVDFWLQGYDLLNSFKFYNTLVGPIYTETTRFSNLHRYLFLGLSFKFNNLK